ASRCGADGVGLYRTEFLYLRQRHLPTEEELFQDYRQVVAAMAPRVVTIRTLDIGGDKFLSPLEYAPEMNPALGLRAIRFCLKEPKIFRTQLKAILRASAFGQVRVMFPLISSPREMQEARQLLESVKKELKREKVPFDAAMPVGAMIEVPAAVTRMVRDVVQVGHQAGIPVAMCGEMAGDPLYIPVLLGLGVEEFSMNPTAIPVVKRVIRLTSQKEARETAGRALGLHTVEEVNAYVTREMDRLFPEIFRFGRP